MRTDTGSTRRYFDDVAEGDALPPLVKEVTLTRMVMYGAATWDFMRIHYDTAFAQAQGFEQVFADGQMLGAFLAQLVVDWAGEPGALRRLGVRYRTFVFPGDTVTCSGHVTRKFVEGDSACVECEVVAKNQHGVIVAGPSAAVVALARREVRKSDG
jgi:acyl dehydratase